MARKILIVDDSELQRKLVRVTLNSAGYEVVEACDGRDAIQKLVGEDFNLIISDVNMPNMDGLAFAEAVLAIPEKKNIPLVFLSTEAEDCVRQRGCSLDVGVWLTKPFDCARLMNVVVALMSA